MLEKCVLRSMMEIEPIVVTVPGLFRSARRKATAEYFEAALTKASGFRFLKCSSLEQEARTNFDRATRQRHLNALAKCASRRTPRRRFPEADGSNSYTP